jgi:hypothetical protein
MDLVLWTLLLHEKTFSAHENRNLKYVYNEYEYEYKQTTVTYIWAVNMCLENGIVFPSVITK